MKRGQLTVVTHKHNSNKTKTWALIALMIATWGVVSCSTSRHVPQGEYLLDNVSIRIIDKENQNAEVSTYDLVNYLRQTENHKVLGGLKLQLAFYNISGQDSTKWFNKWVQRVGTPPVIYDSTLTTASVNQLSRALINKGYMNNSVTSRVVKDEKKRKAKVSYDIKLNEPYYVRSITYNIPNDTLRELILADTTIFPIKQNSTFDHNKLNSERELITERLRENGYFAFNKEYITFVADTAAHSRAVDLTLNTMPPRGLARMPQYQRHRPFYVRNVTFVTDYDPVTMQDNHYTGDTTSYHGYRFIMNPNDHYMRCRPLEECCYITPGGLYNAADVNKTYQALGRLGIVKFISITTQPVGEIDNKLYLDTYILLSRDKSQSFTFSVEGTNSEGDLGFGVGADYQHRNLLGGSELLNVKFKTSYESLSGNLNGLINNNYSEYAAEAGITYPKFKAPFLSKSFKQRIQASTEVAVNFNYQARPEYTRIMAGTGWKYLWSEQQNRTRHTLNLLDLNYVYLPKSRSNFLDSINNPLLRYSYEDHLIMRMGYSYYHTNKVDISPLRPLQQQNIYTVRASGEIAGNLLYGLSKLSHQHRNNGDAYKVFGISYSQYFKLEGDYSFTHNFSSRNSLALHAGLGVIVPYANSRVAPFEKRFYAGGANGVRGWGVRTLGPGSFNASNSQNSFIYQCGDIKLALNAEFRSKLFWVIESALFVDAGNIWTIRDYPDQPNGVFRLNKFYEQVALAYGLGLRMNFTYFLVRLDMGMKAYNPASKQDHWPLLSPSFKRDAEFHFSVGYPF